MMRFPHRIACAVMSALVALATGPVLAQDAAPMMPVPVPPPVAATDAVAALPGTHLWYWDTGGDGIPIVLLHPATGSGLIWGYQQPAFAKAG